MKNALLSTVVLLLVASVAAAAPQNANHSALTLPISGTFTDVAGGRGTFQGTFKLLQFAVSGDALVARGYLSGTLTDSLGIPIGSVMKAVELPARVSGGVATARLGRLQAGTNATCDILNLVLGPLHLDLLGLTVHLNQVVLDIAAETGAGNLLGNLLCAILGLLDGAGALVDVANLLNRVLDVLTGILG